MLHIRYRLRLYSSLLQNEEILKKATSDYQEKLKRSEEKYRLLKKHAEEKIERFVFTLFAETEGINKSSCELSNAISVFTSNIIHLLIHLLRGARLLDSL